LGYIFLKIAEKARKDLNGELFPVKSLNNKKPLRICKYENKHGENLDSMRKNLLVKNLDTKISAKEFYKMFEVYGDIKSSKLETFENGESKGYGYVYYNNPEEAEEALKEMVLLINIEWKNYKWKRSYNISTSTWKV
jgi:polyadenylate-binding protein